MSKYITHEGEILGIIISHEYREPGIHFFTPDNLSQQLGFMHHAKGKLIDPHIHNPVKRDVTYTQEALFIRKGKLRVDFYSHDYIYIESHLLQPGDVILLVSGGHGFEVIEDVEMIEVKQGPYLGDKDKTRIPCIDRSSVILKD